MRPASVYITGVGVLTSLGKTAAEFGDALLAGRSGAAYVRGFDVSQHPSQVAAQVGEVPCPTGFQVGEFDSLSRTRQVAAYVTVGALHDAGLWDCRDALRIGLVLGIGCEWLIDWESDGSVDLRPQPDSTARWLAQRLGLSGPVATLSAACASGNHAIAVARSWLRRGWVDVAVAGGCDMAVTPVTLATFGNLRALTRRNDEPKAASRPFDHGRDGFVLAEGGAACVLERADDALLRGAQRLAEVAGCGASSDAHHAVIPHPDGIAAAAAIRAALVDAGLNADEIDYVNAHGTGTPAGDVAEVKALRHAFGPVLDQIPVSSTKSMTGHLLTAAASAEAVAAIIAMRLAAIPPTINLDDPDPDCRLFHVANQAIGRPVRSVVSNSFGFGGSNTCLILRKAG